MTGSASAIAMHLERSGWRGMSSRDLCWRRRTLGRRVHSQRPARHVLHRVAPAGTNTAPGAQPQRLPLEVLNKIAQQHLEWTFALSTDRAHAARDYSHLACYFRVFPTRAQQLEYQGWLMR